ncbi:MAG: hypothetical protein KDA20_06625 [Phycisphaerales bacterium]|nr:hypothetical protein [Phycisphaerales bacterium]
MQRRALLLMTWLSALLALAPAPASAQPAGPQLAPASTATLAVRGVQGTAKGAPVKGDVIELHLFQGNQIAHRFDAVLDDNGLAMFNAIPLATPLRPLVRIMHAGVVYQEVGPLLEPTKPTASMDVAVYDTKLDKPAWEIALRSLMAWPDAQQVSVSEILVVESPADYTWLGGDLDERDQRTTVSVSLPTGARDVNLDEGFHGWCCTKFDGSLLEIQMPLMPGRAAFRYSYKLPVNAGSTELEVAGPVLTRVVEFQVPETVADVRTHAVTAAGMKADDQGALRVFESENQPPNERCGVVLAGLISELPPMAPAHQPNLGMRIGAGVGLALVLAVLLYVLFARKPKPRRT